MPAEFTAFERFWLRSSFEFRCITSGVKRGIDRFEAEASRILNIINECDYDLLGRNVTIPRLIGLRQTSRSWTVYMTIEHLRLHNEFLARLLPSIVTGQTTRGTDIANATFVPDDVGADCIDSFQESVWQFAGYVNNLVESGQFPRSSRSIQHPLLGLLDARRLILYSSFHLKIHRRQILKILAVEGVV